MMTIIFHQTDNDQSRASAQIVISNKTHSTMAKKTIAARPPSRKTASRKSRPMKKSKKIVKDPVVDNWQSMFLLAEHWRSDLEFFATELNFFRKLIDKYLLHLIDEDHIKSTRQLATDLTRFDKDKLKLDQDLTLHLSHLSSLIQNPIAHDSRSSVMQHDALEASILDLIKRFRSLKSEVFAVAEKAMESEKAKHLLAG